MSKSKSKRGFRARARDKLENLFGTPPSTAAPSARSSSPAPIASASTLAAPTHQSAAAPEESLSAPVSLSSSPSAPVLPAEAADPQVLPPPTASPAQAPPSTGSRSAVWSGFHSALRGLHESCSLFPPLQSVIGNLLLCIQTIAQSGKNESEFEELVLQLTALSESLGRHLKESKSAVMSDAILNTTRSIQKQVELIQSRQERSTGRRLVEAEQDRDEIMKCYRQIQVLFDQLQIDANLSVWSIANEQIADTRLGKLRPVTMATYDSSLSTEINRRKCTEKTRTDVLSNLDNWSDDPHAPNVYWMNGMAGTGKTTIACTFADALKNRKRLAASFFCTRTSAECQDVTRIVSTIAYQLARYSTSFQSVLCRVLGNEPDLGSSVVSTQFQRLLKEPLIEVKDAIPGGLVVVIDALDECTAPKGVELVLEMLFRATSDLPLKFFVTSRPEPVIRNKIHSQPNTTRSVFVLHDIEESLVQSDIELYLRDELDPKVITPIQVKELAKLAGRLFIYAATAVRYIKIGEKTGDLERRLQTMLYITAPSGKKHAAIDQLYESILSAAINDESFEEQEKDRMRLVLWTVVCAREPISVETLTELAEINDYGKTLAMLQPLRSVLYVSETNNLVTTLHASLPDFIFDATRSSAFFCDTKHHNQLLTHGCFGIMKRQLRFNICELESSHIPDEEVPSLEERVAKAVSPTLAYACRYWADHLRQSAASDILCAQTWALLSERLLFWMEVMNLKHWMGISAQVLLSAKLWLTQVHCAASDLVKLVEDARDFVTEFAANAVSQSTPHLYLSALRFCHRSSFVFKQYAERVHKHVEPKGTGIECRGAALLASWTLNSEVNSVAYSPDGTQLAIGCANSSIVIKDAHDGNLIGAPFEGHTLSVTSVAFSPDGSHIVSGSHDNTIRVWSIRDGALFGAPFKGHTYSVASVAFSPDGSRIVSGSYDKTIRVWNIQDGALIGAPFEGHTSSVTSVAFSPDGSRVASGSWDKAIRVWNIQDGALVGTPFEGHTAPVTSVAFSPNGSHVVSGSDDKTIRLWSIQDGALVGVPFDGHTHWVTAVAFSPDGSRIVSGSYDRTIRVWNIQDGALVGTPFEGHTRSVTSVAFLPDGSRIVSGSSDQTVRVWSIQDGALVGAPSEGHTRSVTSVAFSPDGSHIVSGSDDTTIRLWSIQDGAPVGTPFKGHTAPVTSVAFSPDGSRVASGSLDETIRVWNIQDGALVGTPFEGHTAPVTSVAFSPNGSHVVSGSDDKTIRLWSIQDGALVGVPFDGHTHWVTAVAFSPDGSRIVSGSYDRTIRVWNIQDGALVGTPFEGHTRSVTSVAFLPDGSRIVSGSSDQTVRVWSIQDGALVGAPSEGHTRSVTSVAFSPDGSHIVSGSDDTTIRLWSIQDGAPVGTPFKGHTAPVTSVAFSPDGSRVASGSLDETIRVWNIQDGALVGTPFEGHTAPVTSVAFSPDGSHIVSGSDDKTIRVWNIQDGAPIGTPFGGHTYSVTSVAFSPDGSRIVSGSDDKTIRVWNIQDGAPVGAPFKGHTAPVTSVAFSPDGSLIVSGSDDEIVRVWNIHHATWPIRSFKGHAGSVRSVAFSPDGSHIVSGSEDRTIRVWDIRVGASVDALVGALVEGHTHWVTSVAFSPDGSRIVSGSHDQTIRVWSIQDSAPIGTLLDDSTDSITSVAFVSNGSYIVSGSDDQTTPSSQLSLNAPMGSVTFKDGWLISNSQLLCWIPPDLAQYLSPPHNLWVAGPKGVVYLDLTNTLLRNAWPNCYLPRE